jgi:hypothetical protein
MVGPFTGYNWLLQVYNFLMKRQTSCTSAKDNYFPTLTVNVSCFEQTDELQCDALTCSFLKEKKTFSCFIFQSYILNSMTQVHWQEPIAAQRQPDAAAEPSSCASALDREIKAMHSAHCCPVSVLNPTAKSCNRSFLSIIVRGISGLISPGLTRRPSTTFLLDGAHRQFCPTGTGVIQRFFNNTIAPINLRYLWLW